MRVKFTSQEYLERYGVSLSKTIKNEDEHSNKVERFIDEIVDIIYDYIHQHCPSFSEDDDRLHTQLAIKNAELEQARYIIENGNLYTFSGFDVDGSLRITANERDKMTFSPRARTILLNGGLLYAGL
jgi:hypothetical protein